MVATCVALAAVAQIAIGHSPMMPAWRPACGDSSDATCVSVNLSLSVPEPANLAPADWTKAVAKANESLYDLVNHECDVLRTTLKGECRLSQLNVSANMRSQQEASQPQTINASANASYVITPKTPAEGAGGQH